MCHKCENHHSELFQDHHKHKLDEDINAIFTGFCKEKNHYEQLEFFCKNHNQLCCAACISKIKREGKGQHTDCDVCNIEDIKNEKKNNLKENIKILNSLSSFFQQSIDELKQVFEKIHNKKEELKLQVQKIFTNIRNKINEREDQLLLKVDNQFDKLFIKEDIIKDSEKLPNEIKILLEKGEIIDNDWNDTNKLNSLLNTCINIENNIKNLNIIKENIKKCNKENIDKIKFVPNEENKINIFSETINSFGDIIYDDYFFKFKKCHVNVQKGLEYEISGPKQNIATKTVTSGYLCVICENAFEKNKIYKWKIKILKTNNYDIKIGITTIDFMEKSQNYENGWYLFLYNNLLYSGPPHNITRKKTNLKKNENIIVIMDMNKRTLTFMNENIDKGDSYNDIPIDKSLFPSVIFYDQNDSVEITNY